MMEWRPFIRADTCNYEKRPGCLILYRKPVISYSIGDRIYIPAISESGKRMVRIALTFDEAKRLVREIEKHLETKQKRMERHAFDNFQALFGDERGDQ